MAEDWRDRALCHGADPTIFYPEDYAFGNISPMSEAAAMIREAKAICRNCPVRGECLVRALDADERFGIWGGLTAPERKALGA